MKKYSTLAILLLAFGFISLFAANSATAQSSSQYTGYYFMQPQKTIIIKSLVSAQVKAVNFQAQDYVKKDQVIIKLDDDLQQLEKTKIQVSIELSVALEEAKIKMTYADDTLQIVQKLYNSKLGESRVGSLKELKEAQQSFALAGLAVKKAQLEIKTLQLQLKAIEKNITFYSIKAETSGVIVPFKMVKQLENENVKKAEVGEIVVERQTLIAIMKVDKLRISSRDNVKNYASIKIGQKAKVIVIEQDSQSEPIDATVVYKSPAIFSTNNFEYEVEFDNPTVKTKKDTDYPFRYRPGTRVKVELIK